MRTKKLFTAAVVIVTAWIMAACSEKVAYTELEPYLLKKFANSADKPYTVALAPVNISSVWADINAAVQNAGRYVVLDLNDCTADGNTVVGSFQNPSSNDMNIVKGNQYIKGLVLPFTLQSIGEFAFVGCAELESVIIPLSVTSIESSAFRESGITSIKLPDSVTSIGNGAFYGCKGLTLITIPPSVTSIGSLAFYECEALTSITIPDSVAFIGDDAFVRCEELTSVTLPSSLTSIGNDVFYACYKLESIIIPPSITSIGDFAFYGCGMLRSITIPASVTYIGKWAFAGCELMSVTFEEGSNIGRDSFVDDELKNAYLSGGAGTYTRTNGGKWIKQ